ncbi:MAG: glycoside hydrolase family 13 protein [Elusimicrobiota bacterium]
MSTQQHVKNWAMFFLSAFICVFYLCNLCFTKTSVKFVYDPAGKIVSKVAIAGTFNTWNKNADILKKQPDGEYTIEIPLNDGMHFYKFVIDDNQWIEDPLADKTLRKPDGYGGFNSGIFVGEKGEKYGIAKPDDINIQALKYEINVISTELVELKLRTLKNDVETVVACFPQQKIVLTKTYSSVGFDYYSDIVEIKNPGNGYFQIRDDKTLFIFPNTKNIAFELKPVFSTPDWAKGCVWYQIMLDRFANGEKLNDPKNTLPWTWDFNKPYSTERGSFYQFVWGRFFGGDLQGLIKKLTYLKGLGVEAIYLNPVFESNSYQKYNTNDYRHIDQHFGYLTDYSQLHETLDPETWKWTDTDKLFLEFLKQAHSLGIKVIVDGVFNHSGENHWAFVDLKQKNEKSVYKDWFIVTNWETFRKYSNQGKGYTGWAGFGGLPEFQEDENGLIEPVKKHIFEITKRWMDPNNDGNPSDGIDGWRLDVPDCVKMPFWKEWCALVKKINPDAYIVGELWGEAPDWLTKELFHSQMNYPLVKLAIKFLVDKTLSSSQFEKSINHLLSTYPMQVNFVQLNLLDSHDTDRIASMIYNPQREYDKRNRLNPRDGGDYNKNYKNTKPSADCYQLLKLITAFQFTFVGSPCIWYGDEVGMWGADDPFDRKPMLWRELKCDEPGATVDEELLTHYKKISAIRKKYSVFKTGLYKPLIADDEKNVFGFVRIKGDRIGVVILNNSDKTQKIKIPLPEGIIELKDTLTNKTYKIGNNNVLNISLKPLGYLILVN